uniref:Uncharacterized protein n=1 Tax=Ficedula albicollis TaxID=59894 RepID=A0A803V703_FICAL
MGTGNGEGISRKGRLFQESSFQCSRTVGRASKFPYEGCAVGLTVDPVLPAGFQICAFVFYPMLLILEGIFLVPHLHPSVFKPSFFRLILRVSFSSSAPWLLIQLQLLSGINYSLNSMCPQLGHRGVHRDQVRKNRKKWKVKGRRVLRNIFDTSRPVYKLQVELWRAGARG